MKKLIIDCATGKNEYIEMIHQEEQKRLDEIVIAEQEDKQQKEKEKEKKDAKNRLKDKAKKDKNLQDLLLVLGVK